MAKVKDLIRRAAVAPGTVLITGETGTGKELAARAIHAGSPRAAKPFVALNCAALTESLLESELFGHAHGAFTGAAGARAGLIEHAEGGTLFLDEIGTLTKALQAKLLRALESGEVRRIGENDSRTVDVRFVAATNIDLKAATAAGEFRSDLYYRVHVHHVHMPPLRERSGDIPLLVAHFLARYGAGAGVTACTPAAMDVLTGYAYPGNVRQLEHSCSAPWPSRAPPSSTSTTCRRNCWPSRRHRSAGRHGRRRARERRSATWSSPRSPSTPGRSAPPPANCRSAGPRCGG